MRLGQLRIERQRGPGFGLGPPGPALDFIRGSEPQILVRTGHGQPGPGQRVFRIDAKGGFERVDRRARAGGRVLHEGGPAGQVRRIRRGVARVAPAQTFLLGSRQLQAQRSGDALGDDRLGVVELVGTHAHAIRPDCIRFDDASWSRAVTVTSPPSTTISPSSTSDPGGDAAASLGADRQESLSAEPRGDGVGEAQTRRPVVAASGKGRTTSAVPAIGGLPPVDRHAQDAGGQREEDAGAGHHPPPSGSPAAPAARVRRRRQVGSRRWRRHRTGAFGCGWFAIRRKRGDRCDEPIAAAGQRLDEARRFGDVPQRGAQLPHRVVDPLFEVDERVVSPQCALQFVAGDQVVGTGQEQGQQLQGLRPYGDQPSGLAQLERASVEVEDPEPVTLERTGAV